MLRTLIFLLSSVLLIGCELDPLGGSSSVDRTLVVRSGVTFGLCQGYCWRELTIDPEQMSWTERSANTTDYPTITQHSPTSSVDWNLIRQEVDFDAFRGLDGVYGCPDCADGGAEWIEVTFDGETKRILFEAGKTVAPIAGLTRQLRTLRARFES